MSGAGVIRMRRTRERRAAGKMLVANEIADDWPLILAALGYLPEWDTEDHDAFAKAMNEYLAMLRATYIAEGKA